MEVSTISEYQEERDYPTRLYAEGASVLDNKKLNHYCRISDLRAAKQRLGVEVWEQLKQSPLGIIVKLADTEINWSAKTVHYLLCRQLCVEQNEIWFIFHDQPIRFGLIEFKEITGLNIDPLPKESFEPLEQCEYFLKNDLLVQLELGPSFKHLKSALNVCGDWSVEKRKWLGLLVMLARGVHAHHSNSDIPLESAKRVFDDQAMMSYPWGRIGFDFLVSSIQTLSPAGGSYGVNGLVYALMVWAYEFVTCFRERFGRGVNVVAGNPLLLRWVGTRTRADLVTVISGELETHGNKVELRITLAGAREAYGDE